MHLIMFDIDGTLVNSDKFDEECYLRAAETVLEVKISSNWEDYEYSTAAGVLDEVIERYKIPGSKKQIHQDFKNLSQRAIPWHRLMGSYADRK